MSTRPSKKNTADAVEEIKNTAATGGAATAGPEEAAEKERQRRQLV